MFTKKLEQAFNEQIQAEFFSAYLYLSMSAYLHSINLNGFAQWMRMQAQEEVGHAMKFFDFVIDRGGRAKLSKIDEPTFEWSNVIDVFEEALKHEKYISERINNLMNLAIEEKDHASVSFLQWFVDEQVEEEASVDQILQQLKMIDGKGSALLMLDREAQNRTQQTENQ